MPSPSEELRRLGSLALRLPGLALAAIMLLGLKPGTAAQSTDRLPQSTLNAVTHERVLMHGPVVYCLEALDNPGTDVLTAALPREAELSMEHRELLLGGLTDEAPATSKMQSSKDPVQVFILAGQSNMQGQGVVDMDDSRDYNGGKGNLEYVMEHSPLAPMYAHLKDATGEWAVRQDVWIRHRTEKRGLTKGNLTIGFTGYGGRTHIGPELQIGHVLGDRIEQQVLLIKTAWGGKSLHKDFRPPRSGGSVGPFYTKMLQEVQEALDELGSDFPAYEGNGYEIAGFIWFQGWNDMVDEAAASEYEANLVNLIHDLRAEWALPRLPVVIGELGNGGEDADARVLAIRKAQAAVAARSEFAGTVAFSSTTDFARPAKESPNTGHGHHWFGNAESYFLIGKALGETMSRLLGERRTRDR